MSGDFSSLPNWALTVSKKSAVIKMSWMTFGIDPYEMPAGTVATITFTANETTTVAELDMNVTCKLSDSTAITAENVAVTVCPDHNVVETVVEGSCVIEGYTTYSCETCGYHETIIDGYNADNHCNLVYVESKEASCFEEGNVEYWYCTSCGAAWLDENCTLVTSLLSVVLPATSHTDGDCVAENKVPGTWELATYCINCGTETSRTAGEYYAAGSTIVVTVSMNEAANGVTFLQGELTYDEAFLSCDSVSACDGFEYLTLTISRKSPMVKFNWIDFTGSTTDFFFR